MKTLKILLVSLVGLAVVLSLAVVIAIKVFLPEDKIKSYVTDYAKNNLNREVTFDSLSFKFIGIDLKNFKMSEKATFNEGTFIKSDDFIIKISPLPLLSKKIKISNILFDSIDINITKDENGLFNFDDIIKSFQNPNTDTSEQEQNNQPKQESAQNSSFNLNINRFNIKNANLSYEDKKTNLSATIKNLNLLTNDFSFTDIFYCETSFDLSVKQNKLDISLPLAAKFRTNVNNFDMDKLFLDLETFETTFNNATISLQGKVENLNVPEIDCNLIIKNIDDKTFQDFFKPKMEFKADEITFKTKSVINIASMTADIESLNLVLPNSSSDVSGTIDWGKQDIEYNIKLNLDLLIDNFAKAVPEYNLTGRLKTSLQATQNFCEGNFILENISSKSEYGTLSDLNTEFYLKAENKTPLHKADFKTLDIDFLSFIIKQISLKYNQADISATGDLTKQENSVLNLNLKSKNVTNDTFKKFYTCPVKFILPTLDIDTNLNFNLKSKSANISKLNIKIPDSSADITGSLNWKNEKNFIYNLVLNLNLLLDNIAKNFPEYKMKGKVLSNAKISNNDFSGNLSCTNLAFDYLPVASVSNLNLQATAKSKKNIVIKSANGIFNEGKFNVSGSLINKDIKFNLTMDKLKIVTSTQTATKKQETKKETSKKSSSSSQPFNYNIYTDISISEINIPYLTSKKAALKTSLKTVTNTMKKANGTFDLNISTGTITNVDKLTDNKMAKTFLSLFNIINNNRTEETKANSKNDISFQNITTNVLFTDGVIKTNDVSIKIPTAKIIAKGTIDLKTEALNLAVSAGNYTGMKIGGTMSDPKISYDVAAALSNALSDKNVTNALLNLFKVNNKKEEPKQETTTQETKAEEVKSE
ncbi:MAG: AsmA family protein [Elusimicrobia bacterium]|nr:AsmA family protein [Elusimicrobiota bacterium]